MARKAIDTHARSFVVNEDLVLLVLKTFAHCFQKLGPTQHSLYFSLSVATELSVFPTNNSSLVQPQPAVHRTETEKPSPHPGR